MSVSGTHLTNCRLCDSSDLNSIIDFGYIPLGNNLNFSIKDSIRSEKFPLVVDRCNSCGHFQLSFSVNKEILYQRDYSYLSSIGKKFVDHLEWSANDIFSLKKLDIKKTQGVFVIDIGSNDGTALSFFKRKGCKVLGIDPSDLPVKEASKKNIETINEFFDSSLAEKLIINKGQADIIISHNVLAHVEDLKDIFLGVFKLLKDEGIFIFEIGYFANMIKYGIYDTIYHEHLDYHTLKPIINFLNSIGFSVFSTKIVESQGGSLRIYCNKLQFIKNNNQKIQDLLISEGKLIEKLKIETWKNNIFNNAKQIKQKINQVITNKGEIFGYGAPTKSTLACKIIEIERNNIKEILDDNKIKVGRYLPALGIPIVSKFSSQITPSDLIICFAWNFIEAIVDNIRNQYGSNISIISTQNGKVYKT